MSMSEEETLPPALVERTRFEWMRSDRDHYRNEVDRLYEIAKTMEREYARMERVAREAQAALRRIGREIDARLDIGSPSDEDLRMWKRMIGEALNA